MGDRSDTAGEPRSFQVSDVDAARAVCAEFFYDVRLEPLDPTAVGFGFAVDVARLGPVTVGDLRFCSDISISVGDLEAYQVSLPLDGRLESEHRGSRLIATPQRAAVYQPVGTARAVRWEAGCHVLCVKLEQAAVEAEASALLGRPVRGPLRFGPSLDGTDGAGLTWIRTARLLHSELDNPGSLLFTPPVAERYWRWLIAALLMSVDHQYADELNTPARAVRPRKVRRAIDAIEADPSRPLTTTDLAAEAGVSVRSLQAGFREHLGLSPMAYLQQVRLARTRTDLLAPPEGRASVAAIAHRWGFGHLGRFAAAYRARYGEAPSDTLRGYSPGSP
jgi:AraC-like DNA-binding protein